MQALFQGKCLNVSLGFRWVIVISQKEKKKLSRPRAKVIHPEYYKNYALAGNLLGF